MTDINDNNIDNIVTDEDGEKFIKGDMEDNSTDNVDKNEPVKVDEKPTQIITEKEEPKKRGKKPRKKELIESIKKAYEQLGEECDSNRQLSRTKITILEKKLADATSRLTHKIMDAKKTEKQKEYVSKIPDDMAVRSLYNLNVIASNTIEKLVNHFGEDSGVSLEGWTKNLCKEREEELKACLKEIIEKHGDQVKQYMDPMAIYLMLIVTTASETIAVNAKKNSTYGGDTISISSHSSLPVPPSSVTISQQSANTGLDKK